MDKPVLNYKISSMNLVLFYNQSVQIFATTVKIVFDDFTINRPTLL